MPAKYMIQCTYKAVEGGMKIDPSPDPHMAVPGDLPILKFLLGDLLIIRSSRRKKFIIDLKPSLTIHVDPHEILYREFYAAIRPEWIPELFRLSRSVSFHDVKLLKGESIQYLLPTRLLNKTRVYRFTMPDLVYPRHLLIPERRVNTAPDPVAVQLSLF